MFNRLESLGIIVPLVDDPTEGVAAIVVVFKGDTVRLCCDYMKLNKRVLRSHFPINKVETTLAQLSGYRYFSKLDANNELYQLKSKKISKFNHVYYTICKFKFTRLLFAINCAPEYFSQKFSQAL